MISVLLIGGLTIATIATDKLTRTAYKQKKPRKAQMAKLCRALLQLYGKVKECFSCALVINRVDESVASVPSSWLSGLFFVIREEDKSDRWSLLNKYNAKGRIQIVKTETFEIERTWIHR